MGTEQLLMDAESQRILIRNLRIADSWQSRTRGLLDTAELNRGEGLLLTPCNSIHTFGMSYALDIVYVGYDRRIVRCLHQVPPRRVSFEWRARAVIELKAGEAHRLGLFRGQKLCWQSVS